MKRNLILKRGLADWVSAKHLKNFDGLNLTEYVEKLIKKCVGTDCSCCVSCSDNNIYTNQLDRDVTFDLKKCDGTFESVTLTVGSSSTCLTGLAVNIPIGITLEPCEQTTVIRVATIVSTTKDGFAQSTTNVPTGGAYEFIYQIDGVDVGTYAPITGTIPDCITAAANGQFITIIVREIANPINLASDTRRLPDTVISEDTSNPNLYRKTITNTAPDTAHALFAGTKYTEQLQIVDNSVISTFTIEVDLIANTYVSTPALPVGVSITNLTPTSFDLEADFTIAPNITQIEEINVRAVNSYSDTVELAVVTYASEVYDKCLCINGINPNMNGFRLSANVGSEITSVMFDLVSTTVVSISIIDELNNAVPYTLSGTIYIVNGSDLVKDGIEHQLRITGVDSNGHPFRVMLNYFDDGTNSGNFDLVSSFNLYSSNSGSCAPVCDTVLSESYGLITGRVSYFDISINGTLFDNVQDGFTDSHQYSVLPVVTSITGSVDLTEINNNYGTTWAIPNTFEYYLPSSCI